jgi:hypothetical protein
MKRLLFLLSLAVCCGSLRASVTIDLSVGQLLTAAGAPVPDGGLIQLLAAPSTDALTPPSDASFTGGSSAEIVLASFGLDSASTGTAGSFDSVIHLTLSGGLQAGDPLLLRWYPTLTAAAGSPGSGTSYGQYRTDAVVDGSDIAWVTPGDGATDALNFTTSSQGGSQPNSAGEASETTPSGSPAGASPQITSATSIAAVVGSPFSYQIAASNSPTSYRASGLPAGLSVNGGNGLITGTPTQAGSFDVGLAAMNAAGAGTATLLLSVQAPASGFPKITSATSADAVAEQFFSYQITAANSPVSFGASGLPAGLSVGTDDGVISGVPTVSGVFNVSLSATNSSGTGTGFLTLTVGLAPVVQPAITSVLTVNANDAVPFSYQIVASNMPSVYGASGLPAALSVNPASGLISGPPTEAGTFSVGLSAGNSGGIGTATLVLTVNSGPVPAITSAGTAGALLDQPFAYQITAANGPTSFGASGLPSGLSVGISTGLIAGTPTETGIFRVGLSAGNASGTGTASLTLTASPEPPVTPVITSVLAVNCQATVPFRYQITADNDPASFHAAPLPAGLALNAASGLITGKPANAGKYALNISASNAAGTGMANLNLKVVPAPLPTVAVNVPTPQVKVGTGAVGEFTLTLSKVLHADLSVHYAVMGTAVNGEDYRLLNGIKKITAGEKKVAIKVFPLGNLGGATQKTIRFILESGRGYTIKAPAPVVKLELIAKP